MIETLLFIIVVIMAAPIVCSLAILCLFWIGWELENFVKWLDKDREKRKKEKEK